MHLRSLTSRPFCLHKTSKTPLWWLTFSHRPHTRTFLSPHMTSNIQSCRWQLWCQNFQEKSTYHLINTFKKLQCHYWVECGIKLKWAYDKKNTNISMTNHINNALARKHHYPPIKPQYSPHPYDTPVYGQKRQFFISTTTNKRLTPAQLKHCQ